MSEDKPDYAAIIKSRKPVPTLDLGELRRRSAEATGATIVLQPSPGPANDSPLHEARAAPMSSHRDEATKIEPDTKEHLGAADERVPLRFSVSKEDHHRLRIQAAVENRSVPELMRAIIADYLRVNGRAP